MKRFTVILLCLCLCFGLSACKNTSARPSGNFSNIRDFLDHYAELPFEEGEEFAERFLRDMAGLIQKTDDLALFEDWERKDTSTKETESAIFSADRTLFGSYVHVDVGFDLKYSRIAAISLVLETGEAETDCSLASQLSLGIYGSFGGSYEAYLDGVKENDKTVKAALAEQDAEKSFSVIWPKSSVKWSAMVSYQPGAEVGRVSIYVL